MNNIRILDKKAQFVIVLIFFIVAIPQLTFAQLPIQNVDSLLNVLSNHHKKDTIRVNLLNDISFAYYPIIDSGDTTKIETALQYANEALDLSEKLDYKYGIGRAYNSMGTICVMQKQYYESYVYFKKSEQQYILIGDSTRLCYAYNNTMYVLGLLGDTETARTTAYELFDLSVKKGLRTITAYAISTYYAASPMLGNTPPDEKEINALNFIIDYPEQFDERSLWHIRRRYAQMLAQQKDYDRALEYAHKASNDVKLDKRVRPVWATLLLAEIHARIGNVDSARYYMDKTFEIDGLGFDKISITEDEKLIDHLTLNYHVMYISMVIDSLKGNWRSAFHHYQNSIIMEDSIKGTVKSNEIAMIKNWNEIERREYEKQILMQEKQHQQKLSYLSYSLLTIVLILVAMLIVYYRKRVNDNKLLQQANDELQELHKVKDKLFSLIAHDLRNPMSSFMSMVQLLTVCDVESDKKETILKDIYHKANETYSLLNNLLFWSKSQMNGIRPSPQYFEISKRSNETINQLRQQADNKGVTLKNHIPEQRVYADFDMIDVIVRNLITNAIKYSHRNGTVALSGEVKGDYMEISVKDSGIGIPDDVQQTLFKMTETTSRRGTINETGSGLGLVLSADFARLNGGTIRFESKPGEGSAFYLTIPLKHNS